MLDHHLLTTTLTLKELELLYPPKCEDRSVAWTLGYGDGPLFIGYHDQIWTWDGWYMRRLVL